MRIHILDRAKKEIESKKFNIFIGVSLGNLFFSKKNLRKYILWALKYTCENVVIMIADDIQAVNYQIFKGLSKNEALVKVREQGAEKEMTIKRIVSILPKEDRARIKTIKWNDVISDKYSKKVDLIFEEFEKNDEFRNVILEIVRNAFSEKVNGVEEKDLLKLCEYVLNELPLMIEGLSYDGKFYTVMPYPRKTPLDDFIFEVHKGNIFPELFSKIVENKKIGVVLK